jgi:hypothetical protein
MRSLVVLMLLTAPALAEPKKSAETMHTDDCAKARKVGKTCELTIEDEKVTGNVATGTGTGIAVIDTGKHVSLIRLRREFIVQIIKSAEDL